MGFGFNQMVERLSKLIHQVYTIRMENMSSELRQKDAVIMAMQSQINPHFLYNTLEAINCYAIVHEVPSISRMSKALADFFRYSIEKQQVQVALSQEIRHIETYLQIQQERYPDIQIHLDIPLVLHACPIVKLTLQPLIENAFIHGFVEMNTYYVRISGDISLEGYQLIVEDNGVGMSPVQLKKMNEQLVVAGETPALYDPKEVVSGIGVLNVHTRLRLLFGKPHGLRYCHSLDGGVKVVIQLPLEFL